MNGISPNIIHVITYMFLKLAPNSRNKTREKNLLEKGAMLNHTPVTLERPFENQNVLVENSLKMIIAFLVTYQISYTSCHSNEDMMLKKVCKPGNICIFVQGDWK